MFLEDSTLYQPPLNTHEERKGSDNGMYRVQQIKKNTPGNFEEFNGVPYFSNSMLTIINYTSRRGLRNSHLVTDGKTRAFHVLNENKRISLISAINDY